MNDLNVVPDFEITPELIAATVITPVMKHGTRRICSRCGEPKDKSDFKILKHKLTGRMYFDTCCRTCSKERRKLKKRRQVSREKQQQFREAIARLKNEGLKAPHVSEVWAELVAAWGGLPAFVSQYKAQVDAAIQKGAGSKAVLDAFKALTHLSVHSSNLRAAGTDVALLTDEDIENQLRMMTMRVIKDQPKMLQDMLASGKVELPPGFAQNPDYADPHASQEVARAEE